MHEDSDPRRGARKRLTKRPALELELLRTVVEADLGQQVADAFWHAGVSGRIVRVHPHAARLIADPGSVFRIHEKECAVRGLGHRKKGSVF